MWQIIHYFVSSLVGVNRHLPFDCWLKSQFSSGVHPFPSIILVSSSEFNLGHVLWPNFDHWDAEGSSWRLLGMVSLLLKERHIRRDAFRSLDTLVSGCDYWNSCSLFATISELFWEELGRKMGKYWVLDVLLNFQSWKSTEL